MIAPELVPDVSLSSDSAVSESNWRTAHEHAEQTRQMLQSMNEKQLALEEAEARKRSDARERQESLRAAEIERLVNMSLLGEAVDHARRGVQETSRRLEEPNPTAAARQVERARLIAEAKAKAAMDKRVILEKAALEKKAVTDAKKNKELKEKFDYNNNLHSTMSAIDNDDASSVNSRDSSNASVGTPDRAPRTPTNASRYTAVLSISKEDVRKAAVAKVRQEAKRAAETKAKADVLAREAKLKALLSADREIRHQKRVVGSSVFTPEEPPPSPRSLPQTQTKQESPYRASTKHYAGSEDNDGIDPLNDSAYLSQSTYSQSPPHSSHQQLSLRSSATSHPKAVPNEYIPSSPMRQPLLKHSAGSVVSDMTADMTSTNDDGTEIEYEDAADELRSEGQVHSSFLSSLGYQTFCLMNLFTVGVHCICFHTRRRRRRLRIRYLSGGEREWK